MKELEKIEDERGVEPGTFRNQFNKKMMGAAGYKYYDKIEASTRKEKNTNTLLKKSIDFFKGITSTSGVEQKENENAGREPSESRSQSQSNISQSKNKPF